MNRLMLDVGHGPKQEFGETRRGLPNGCERYLSERDGLSMRAGIFEREISPRFSELAGRARVFVDVGAAEGFFSLYMRQSTEAKVFAFEAAEDFGEADGILGDQAEPVLLKIDVEGDEMEVLEGARSVLESSAAAVVVKVYDSPTEFRCLRWLGAFGFEVEIIGPAWWRRAIRSDRRVGELSHWLIAEKPVPKGLRSGSFQ